ncbi:hypothetical protein C8F04DRAFT_1187296 [Mycena alexandri]|uniref:Uncharacterized protein n=1 Tax=Mycena alexandri TaxID=1745969 RepID=A0AAD6WRK5_9AGAR|nr:hypothetical protein C8F04DRAFT_1195912 [Mycena alexandri]KAJ7029941.1 hypothetical protein C8F04DRAFT_1187296 [Mycena alexandri]
MTTHRCAVPFHPDPGQPARPTGPKFYLVTGANVVKPGAYSSWTSADAQYKGVSNVTLKGYTSWGALQSAWFAGCDRGEHTHPGKSCSESLSVDGSVSRSLVSSPRLPQRSSSALASHSTSAASTSTTSHHLRPPPSENILSVDRSVARSPVSSPRLSPGYSLASASYSPLAASVASAASHPQPSPSRQHAASSARGGMVSASRTGAFPSPRSSADTPPAQSSPARVRSTPGCSGCAARESTPPAPRTPPARSSPLPASSKRQAEVAIAGKMAYAVRTDGQGVVFDLFEDARNLYHDLQAQGYSVSLAAGPSLTDSVSFVENFRWMGPHRRLVVGASGLWRSLRREVAA